MARQIPSYVVVHDREAVDCSTERASIQKANKLLTDSCSCDSPDELGIYRLVAKVKRPKVNADVEYVRK